jgi:hypothetical protein
MSLSRQEVCALSSRLKLRGNYVQRTIFSIDGPVPDAPAKGCDINLLGVIGVSNDAVSPFEVKTRNARPAFPVVV